MDYRNTIIMIESSGLETSLHDHRLHRSYCLKDKTRVPNNTLVKFLYSGQ